MTKGAEAGGKRHPPNKGGFGMDLRSQIADVEICMDQSALQATLQRIVNDLGFSSFCFVDISTQYAEIFHFLSTTGPAWENDYSGNGFFQVDEVIKVARRSNTPFTWRDVPVPPRLGRKKPAAQKVFEAASDHDFTEGLVVPLHFVDDVGRMRSALCSLMWKDGVRDFQSLTAETNQDLHLLLIYWMQRSIELKSAERDDNVCSITDARKFSLGLKLTDREREVIAWAGRGKTVGDIAEILTLSSDTIQEYTKAAIRKLGAGNKTHAVAKAIQLGLIDI